MEANKTADGVLALEKAVATLRREAKEVDGEFQRKRLEVEADAAVIQEVGPISPTLPSSPLTFGLDIALHLLPCLLQTAREAQRVHAKAGQAGVVMQEMLSALEELLHLMSRFCDAAVRHGWRRVPTGV